jgi:hypothetical protein
VMPYKSSGVKGLSKALEWTSVSIEAPPLRDMDGRFILDPLR